MLDYATQTNIKQARNMLVGKIPSPIDQCHEITKALVYKFISDNDRKTLDIGGVPSYFPGETDEYRWDSLMERRRTAEDMRRLYHAGLEYIGNRDDIPDAFRAIYKDALLPYNIDAGTLRLFLETINKFSTADTETIGDAFEHLLMETGAQGKAGQFRTPRHIIDFIVAIINPQKHESVLDPACGTAGFLASAYQHIRNNAPVALGSPDHIAIANNLVGYDLSPDMVKLATIHLYLQHGQSPRVEVYDTITDDGHWNDHYDVILANPPFMTPTGAIKPNPRFYTQANKTEVLFVDYIAGHLNQGGRAGVIVPEGIVFRRDNAYCQLRRLLVENCLVAVISLPAGVFNPYSSVKTSILIMDKSLAKQSGDIAFFKATSDGFDLGAQRRPIAANDLPAIQNELSEYLRRLREGIPLKDFIPTLGHIVAKEQIAASGDHCLVSDRFYVSPTSSAAYPLRMLGEIATVRVGNPAPQGTEFFENGNFPFVRTADVGAIHRSANFNKTKDKVNEKAVTEKRLRLFPAGTILFPKSGASTFLNHRVVLAQPAYVASHLAGIICDETQALPAYVYHQLCHIDARTLTADQSYPSLRASDIAAIAIPLPPLDVQREIITEIEGYQQLIDNAYDVAEQMQLRINDTVDRVWNSN